MLICHKFYQNVVFGYFHLFSAAFKFTSTHVYSFIYVGFTMNVMPKNIIIFFTGYFN